MSILSILNTSKIIDRIDIREIVCTLLAEYPPKDNSVDLTLIVKKEKGHFTVIESDTLIELKVRYLEGLSELSWITEDVSKGVSDYKTHFHEYSIVIKNAESWINQCLIQSKEFLKVGRHIIPLISGDSILDNGSCYQISLYRDQTYNDDQRWQEYYGRMSRKTVPYVSKAEFKKFKELNVSKHKIKDTGIKSDIFRYIYRG